MSTHRATLLLSAATLLAACAQQAPPPPASSARVQASVVTLVPRDLPFSYETVGQTESAQKVEIRARVKGFLDRRVYTEGSMVKQGDVLFVMDTRPFETQLAAARAELAQQQARLKTARANLARVRPLAEQDALSPKDLDDAAGNESAAAAAVEAAKAKVAAAELDLSYCTIRAPVTGLSSFATQQEGTFIDASNSLLTYVAAIDPIRVNFSVSENELLSLREQVAAGRLRTPEHDRYEVEVVLADGSVHPHLGRITFSDAAFSQQTGTFLVRAEVANNGRQLMPGMFVRLRLKGAVRPNAIVVPQKAVQQGANGHFVYVINEQNKAELRPVMVGAFVGQDWLIKNGLQGGERVAVDGLQRLAPGAPVQTVAADTPQSATPPL